MQLLSFWTTAVSNAAGIAVAMLVVRRTKKEEESVNLIVVCIKVVYGD